MARLSAEEIKVAFPVGCVVRIRSDMMGSFRPDFAKKMTDRLAQVTSHTLSEGAPLLTFFAYGRRTELRYSMRSPERYLDVVTDTDAIETWRSEVATTSEKLAARAASKEPSGVVPGANGQI
jgi:hypothetical protein